MSQYFMYEYNFDHNDSEIIVHVSHGFEGIAELETISTFPHKERREFALALMAKYSENTYHKIDPIDITCPFAQRVRELFQNDLKLYWTNRRARVGATLVFLTGFSYIFGLD